MNPQTPQTNPLPPSSPVPVTPPPQDPVPATVNPSASPTNVSPIANDPLTPQVQQPVSAPIGVRVLFILNCIGMGLGVLGLLLLLTLANSAPLGGSLGGIATIVLVIAFALLAIIFFLVYQVFRGKKWALIIYSILIALSTVNSLMKFEGRQIISTLVTVSLVAYIWIKERDYFR